MVNIERRPGFIERVATVTRNGGIVAGIIGLLVSEHLAALGFLTALGSQMIKQGVSKSYAT